MEESIPNTSISNIAGTVRFTHHFDQNLFEKALNRFIEKTESIRIRITNNNNHGPLQYIAGYQYYPLDILNFKNRRIEEFYQWEIDTTLIPFKLYDANLFYFALLKLPDNENAFYFKTHHIITDGWAIVLIFDKILKEYAAVINGNEACPEPEISYVEYILNEQEYLNSERFLEAKEFWSERIQTIPDFIYLKPRNIHNFNTKSNRIGFIIPVQTRTQVETLCKAHSVSPFVFFMMITAIYFSKITNKVDISIGTSFLNRLNAREKDTIGMFVNLIPFRFVFDDNTSFLEYMQKCSHEAKLLMRHQRYPYYLILEDFRKRHNTQDNLFDISFTFHNAKSGKENYLKESRGYWHNYGHQSNSLSMHISDRENNGEYVFNFDYHMDLFSEDEIQRFFHQMMNLVHHGIENPFQTIAEMQLISDTEKHELLSFINTSAYRKKTIHGLFEEQVAKTPHHIALIFKDLSMTYQELNQKSNRLAYVLRKRGIGPNHFVGLMVEPSFQMFIGIFGILKAGAAYVPIDPEYPDSRKRYIIENGNIQWLLTTEPTNLNIERIDVNEIDRLETDLNPVDRNYNSENGAPNPVNFNQMTDLIYMIFTSGTTGNPAGVLVNHKGVVNYAYFRIKSYQLSDQDVTLQLLPFVFDGFASNVYGCLLSGGKLVIGDGIISAHQLISKYQVTNMSLVPSIYKEILQKAIPESFQSLRFVVLGGEKADPELIALSRAVNSKITLINEYGPTENTITTTAFIGMTEDTLPIIGKPISNNQVYIMDKHQNLLPVGTPGEICVTGDGLARGYLNQPELTERKFIRNPFDITKKLYCTGDIARRLPDGNIEFIGRIDHQVKLNGHRIELYEIKEKLMKHESIQLAIVVVNDNQNLCAYYTVKKAVKVSDLRRYLANELPHYMIPQYFKELSQIPFLPSGKVDFKALPSIDRNQNNFEPPANEIEEELVKIWSEVLELEGIGIQDDFFELGGNSLDILKILAGIFNRNWNLKIQDFYQYHTIRELAEYILTRETADEIVLETHETAEQNISRIILEENPMDFTEKRQIQNILLTGATGFLGMHILFELLKYEDIQVYILVRGSDANSRIYELIHFYFPDLNRGMFERKVMVINGDVSQEFFGLTKPGYDELKQKIDTVVHTAAMVKHFGDYQEFYKVNVGGIENIIEFSRDKYVVDISTLSVSGNFIKQKFKDRYFNEKNLEIGQTFHGNYYVQTKYEAEKIISKQLENGLDGIVIRIGNLTGRFLDGVFQRNISQNKFHSVLKSILWLSLIPASIAPMKIEFSPVDLTSQGIVKLLWMKNNRGLTFHLFNHNNIELKTLIEIINEMGHQINICDDATFHNYLKEVARDKNKHDLLYGIINDLENGRLNYISSVIIDSVYSVEILKRLDFIWPQIDSQYIRKIFGHMKNVEFIHNLSK
jgi:amino acid adenylation domain-containing protein/thioester reductase-like protein